MTSVAEHETNGEDVVEGYTNSFVRNCFKDGMLLSADDLSNMQNYLDGKRRLGYMRLAGYGIVYGLTAEISLNDVKIKPGFAVDSRGHEIYVSDVVEILSGTLFSSIMESGEYFLCVEYCEEPFGEAFVISGDKLREAVPNRIQEKFKFISKRSRNDGDICVASLMLEARDGDIQISSLRSPVDAFHFAAVWKGFLPEHKYGSVYINQNALPEVDGIFQTEEIYHGFGCSKRVAIELSIKTYDGWRMCDIFGDSELFGLPVQTAAKVFPESGTFIIAVKSQNPLKTPICIVWHAYTLPEDCDYA